MLRRTGSPRAPRGAAAARRRTPSGLVVVVSPVVAAPDVPPWKPARTRRTAIVTARRNAAGAAKRARSPRRGSCTPLPAGDGPDLAPQPRGLGARRLPPLGAHGA